MSVEKKYSTDVSWGTAGAGTLSYGKILSCTRRSTNKQFEQTDENGELHSLILHDQREEFTLEILAKATESRPALGGTLTCDSVAAVIITEVEVAWKAGDTVKYSITAWKSVA
jgi:hypothetical protein